MLQLRVTRHSSNLLQQRIWDSFLTIIVRTATFPYYRFFNFSTLGPIKLIAACASQSDSSSKLLRLNNLIFQWRKRKLAELHFTSLAVSMFSFKILLKPMTTFSTCQLDVLVCYPCRRRYWCLLLECRSKCLLALLCIVVLQPRALDPRASGLGAANSSA